MKTQEILDPQAWAESTFGQARLQDMRRTRRAVMAAAQMASDPAASLPTQTQTWKDTKAVYRLIDEPDVTFDALMQPHWQQTRERMDTLPLVLRVPDTTDLDFSHRRQMSGLGEIGDGNGRGLYLPARAGRGAKQSPGVGMCLSTSLQAHPCPQRRNANRARVSAGKKQISGKSVSKRLVLPLRRACACM